MDSDRNNELYNTTIHNVYQVLQENGNSIQKLST